MSDIQCTCMLSRAVRLPLSELLWMQQSSCMCTPLKSASFGGLVGAGSAWEGCVDSCRKLPAADMSDSDPRPGGSEGRRTWRMHSTPLSATCSPSCAGIPC